MKIASVKGSVSKSKEKRILKLIHEIEIIKNKISSLNTGLPKIKRKFTRKTKTARNKNFFGKNKYFVRNY